MGIFSLSAMLVAALIAIAIMAATGDNAVFMPGLLQFGGRRARWISTNADRPLMRPGIRRLQFLTPKRCAG